MRKLTPKGLRRKLDDRFRKMIHARDGDEPCVSCGQWCSEKEAGHFILRNRLSTRWHPWNVNGECPTCNHADDGHLVGYSRSIDARYGPKALESLARLGNVVWKPSPDQLERLIHACDDPIAYEEEWFLIQKDFAPELCEAIDSASNRQPTPCASPKGEVE